MSEPGQSNSFDLPPELANLLRADAVIEQGLAAVKQMSAIAAEAVVAYTKTINREKELEQDLMAELVLDFNWLIVHKMLLPEVRVPGPRVIYSTTA